MLYIKVICGNYVMTQGSDSGILRTFYYDRTKGEKEISMSRVYRLISLFVIILSIGLICSCGGDSNDKSTVVVFSDIHFNPFYDPSLFPELVEADISEWRGIFEKSSITAPSASGTDTNFPLLTLALSGIHAQVGDSPFVIFTGDLLGHNIPQTFFKLYGSEDLTAMKTFTDKTIAFLMERIRASVGDVPVLFALGNADSYSGLEPEASFLSNMAELYYSVFLNGTADHETFLESFKAGGYYSVQLYGRNLTVIGLNTMLFFPITIPGVETIANAELAWLDSKLAEAKTNGQKVWLLMHVPAGADIGSTAKVIESNGQLASATMMWSADYQAKFQQILSKYPDIITLGLAAHTHMDEYRIIEGNVLHVSPSISPYFGNNPAFKTFTFSNATLRPDDYISLSYDLATMPKEFQSLYNFSSAYSAEGPLDTSMTELYPELSTDSVQQSLYRNYYYSGPTPANPITDKNWSVYWCGITKMTKQELIDCVNSY